MQVSFDDIITYGRSIPKKTWCCVSFCCTKRQIDVIFPLSRHNPKKTNRCHRHHSNTVSLFFGSADITDTEKTPFSFNRMIGILFAGKEAIATVGVRIGRTAAHVTLLLLRTDGELSSPERSHGGGPGGRGALGDHAEESTSSGQMREKYRCRSRLNGTPRKNRSSIRRSNNRSGSKTRRSRSFLNSNARSRSSISESIVGPRCPRLARARPVTPTGLASTARRETSGDEVWLSHGSWRASSSQKTAETGRSPLSRWPVVVAVEWILRLHFIYYTS